mgnify:CR=1 FL=1
MRRLYPIAVAALCILCTACSVVRKLPEGSYLVQKVTIEDDRNVPKKERITASELDRYVWQSPNKRFLGTNFYVWVYNQSNPDKDNWWNRFKRKIGEKPVVYDPALTLKSAENLKAYMESHGFFSSRVRYHVDTTSRRKRAIITYRTEQGPPSRYGKINYEFNDKFIEKIILQDTASTLIRPGGIFNSATLDAERERITRYLRDRGYYNFSVNNISYRYPYDTVGSRVGDLTMVVKPYMAGYTPEGEPIVEENRVYRLRDIYVFPGYDPAKAVSDSLYNSRLDTTLYRGLKIVYDARPKVRSSILRRTVNLYPNALYNESDVKRTYENIMRLGYYKSASVLFSEASDSAGRDSPVTYIGGPGAATDTSAVAYSSERYLDCNILCTPALRQSYSVELEGTTSSDYFGLTATLGYQNRNLFRGVELFDVSVRGGYEFTRVKTKRNSFELGVTTSFSFPRLITPLRVNRYNRAVDPRTKVEVSYSVQRRPYYHRALASAVWGYSWGKGRNSSFVLRPADISVVKLRQVDSAFLNSLKNPYLRNSYTSQLIAGLSGSYIFNNQSRRVDRSSLMMRFNFETNGNLIDGLSRLFGSKERLADGEPYHRLFGIRYAQYFRIDANIAKKFVLAPKVSIVYRFYGGWGYAYGNSSSIPFERLFYCGGSNSMRGWLARTLGPGGDPKRDFSDYPSQLANFKLETNLEARFPVWGILQGALFFDLGNIWFMNQGGTEETRFKIDRFYKQLGFNTGLGARFDFGFFVFRLDWGIKLHNPNEPAGERWIQHFRLKNTTLNFGVGYPF